MGIGEWLYAEGILDTIKAATTAEAVLKHPEKKSQSNSKYHNTKSLRGAPCAG